MSEQSTKVITPIGTLSYPWISEPQKPKDGKGNPKFSCAIVFAPGTDLKPLKAALIAAAVAKFGSEITIAGKKHKTEIALEKGLIKSALRFDAEAKGYPEGSAFFNTRSDRQPGAVYRHADPNDAKKRPAQVPQEKIKEIFYPGAQVRLSVNAYGYDRDGSKGVTFGFNSIQFMADGERIDGRVAARDEFDADLSEAVPDMADLNS